MELKTKVNAEPGKQEIFITREFDLPVELLFKAYTNAELLAQWMGTNVLKLESKKHGSYRLETSDNKGNVVLKMNGVIHELIPEKMISRTFEMEGTPYGIQLEIYEFEALGPETSRLNMHVIYESVEKRDQVMKLPFAQGINMAHNRMQDIVSKLK